MITNEQIFKAFVEANGLEEKINPETREDLFSFPDEKTGRTKEELMGNPSRYRNRPASRLELLERFLIDHEGITGFSEKAGVSSVSERTSYSEQYSLGSSVRWNKIMGEKNDNIS